MKTQNSLINRLRDVQSWEHQVAHALQQISDATTTLATVASAVAAPVPVSVSDNNMVSSVSTESRLLPLYLIRIFQIVRLLGSFVSCCLLRRT